jgi:large subunit ribosomal protein L23
MSDARIATVLVSPLTSEKTSRLSDASGQYAFKVLVSATKFEIKKAVEGMFKVKVSSIQTVRCKGKSKRSKTGVGRTKQWKKAYVSLAEGHEIDFATKELA